MFKTKYSSKILGIIFLILINYIFIFFSLYIFSAFLLINKITPDIKLIRDYQRNFYQFGGIREISIKFSGKDPSEEILDSW